MAIELGITVYEIVSLFFKAAKKIAKNQMYINTFAQKFDDITDYTDAQTISDFTSELTHLFSRKNKKKLRRKLRKTSYFDTEQALNDFFAEALIAINRIETNKYMLEEQIKAYTNLVMEEIKKSYPEKYQYMLTNKIANGVDEIKSDAKKILKAVEDKNNNSNTPKKIELPKLVRGNIELIGRDNDIDDIAKMLEGNKPVVLINGIGGVGKSALCKYYCENFAENVGWFDYDTSLEKTLLAIVPDCGPDRQMEYKRAKRYLQSLRNDTILVFDNLCQQEQEEIDFLCTLDCKVLITSRLAFDAHSQAFKFLPLGFLTPEKCKEMFIYYCEKDIAITDQYLSEIVDRAGCHTLTVELLAKIFKTSARIKTLKDLLDLLDDKGFDLKNVVTASGIIEEKPFIDHLKILFDVSGIKDDNMLHVLKNMCILPSVPVDAAKILDWLEGDYENALRKLVNSGWIQKSDDNIIMHNVVCETLKLKLEPDYDSCDTMVGSLAQKLNYQNNEIEQYNPPYFTQCLETAKYFNNKNIEKEYLGNLFHNIGFIYNSSGEYTKALEYFKKGLAISEKVLGKEHPDTATSYNNIGSVYKNMGEYTKALEYYKKDLAISKKVLGKEHPDTATSYNNIGAVYEDLGEYSKALEYNNLALSIVKEVLGGEHPYTASTYNNIGSVYNNMGEYTKALEYYKKDLAISEKVLGKEHPSTASSYNNIALLYYNIKDYETALKMIVKAFCILIKVLGAKHPYTQSSYKSLQGIYEASGRDMDEFEEWLQRQCIMHNS